MKSGFSIYLHIGLSKLALAVGRENTLMLPYELLAAAPAEYLRRLFDFKGSRTDELLESLGSVLPVCRMRFPCGFQNGDERKCLPWQKIFRIGCSESFWCSYHHSSEYAARPLVPGRPR